MLEGLVFILFFSAMMLFSFGMAALQLFALWKIFKKAGRPGWQAIIPFYNMFVVAKIGGTNIIWPIVVVAMPFISFISSFIFSFGMEMINEGPEFSALDAAFSMFILFITILTYVATFIMMINLAKKFGKPTIFGVGMAIIPIVFYLILAFDKSKYSSLEVVEDNKKVVCPNCGELNIKGKNFCTNCGEEL